MKSVVACRSWLVVLVAASLGCTANASSNAASDAGRDAPLDAPPSTDCARLGGTCAALRPENLSCGYASGVYEVHAYCGQTSDVCCVQRDADGGLPAELAGYSACGSSLLCPSGTVCKTETDVSVCAPPPADASAD